MGRRSQTERRHIWIESAVRLSLVGRNADYGFRFGISLWMNTVLTKLNKVGRRVRALSGTTTTIWLRTGKKRSILCLFSYVLPAPTEFVSWSDTHFRFTGWSVPGDRYSVDHRLLQMALAGPIRRDRSAPFLDSRAVGRSFQPKCVSNSRSDRFSPQHPGCRHQYPLVFQPRLFISRCPTLHPRQTMDTGAHAIDPHLLSRGHFAPPVPVRRVEELGSEGDYDLPSDSSGGGTRTLPRRADRSTMDPPRSNGCCGQWLGHHGPPLLPRNPHTPRILRR
jgi:hypothetical protein